MDADKEKIIALFNSNVKGKKPVTDAYNTSHAGKGGHWLENRMGIPPNSSNLPDLFGYEMKSQTSSKTTFGDWSADRYLFSHKDGFTRDDFLISFGNFTEKKNRYSWSGSVCPKIGVYNDFGQILKVSADQNIIAEYSFSEDKRRDKNVKVPMRFQLENLTLAEWQSDTLRRKVEKKFNEKGWFICLKDEAGIYSELGFGPPLSYEDFLSFVLEGEIFFDSGMYQGNTRPYSMWRADNKFWYSLIVERY